VPEQNSVDHETFARIKDNRDIDVVSSCLQGRKASSRSATGRTSIQYTGIEGRMRAQGNVTDFAFAEIDQFAAETDDFSDCISNDEQTHVPGEEGRRDQRIMAAIYEPGGFGQDRRALGKCHRAAQIKTTDRPILAERCAPGYAQCGCSLFITREI
jgi:hypothetical protein